MTNSFDYDVVIIGGGPGGYVAAIRAAQLKLSVAVIEHDRLGGVCLNLGCIPSKSLIHQATQFSSTAALERMGVTVDRNGFDYRLVHSLSRKTADMLSRGVAYLLKKNGVTVINGTGRIVSPHEVSVNGTERTVTGRNLIIATGSRPRAVAGFGFDEKTILSSNGMLMLEELPARLLILGAGAIGVEFAYIMSCFNVKVHLVEMADHILPLEDEEASEIVRKSLVRRNVMVSVSTKAVAWRSGPDGAEVTLENGSGVKSTVHADRILSVTGRTPNTDDTGLESIGISCERGFIPVGDFCETATKGVYAIGDVVNTPLLAHVASKEGEIAAERIAGVPSARAGIDLHTVPGAIYCEPQIAGFGYTERAAKQHGIDFSRAVFPYRGAGKAVAIEASEGFVKILSDKKDGNIIGAHIVGSQATELVHELLLAKSAGLSAKSVAQLIHAHPTLSETVMEAARAATGLAIHV